MKIKNSQISFLFLLISMIWTINYSMSPTEKSKKEWENYKTKQLEIVNNTKSDVDIYEKIVTSKKTTYLVVTLALDDNDTFKKSFGDMDYFTQLVIRYNSCPTLVGSLVYKCSELTLPGVMELARNSQANDVIVIKLEGSYFTPSGITYSISHRAK